MSFEVGTYPSDSAWDRNRVGERKQGREGGKGEMQSENEGITFDSF